MKTLILFLLLPSLQTLAQVDTLFRLAPDQRLVNVWINITGQIYSPDSVAFNNYLDTVISLAGRHNDDRLKWYAKYFKLLHKVFHQPAGKTKLQGFQNIKSWVDDCPVPAIKGSYQHLYGTALFEAGSYAEAIERELQAYRLFKEIGLENIPEVYSYLQSMAFMYYFFEDYPRTLQMLQDAEKSPYHSTRGLINNYNTQGMAYQKMKNYEAAKEQFKKAIDLASLHSDSAWIGIASGNYGYTVSLQGQYSEAIPWLETDYRINYIGEPKNTAITAVYLAQAKLRLGDINAAKKYLESGRHLESIINDPVFYTHYYKTRAEYFEAVNDHRNANLYLDSCIRLKDSLKIVFNSQLLSNAERRLEAAKFVSDLDRAANEKKASQLTRNLVIAGAAVVIAFVLLLLLWRNRAFKKEQEIHRQKEALMQVEKQRVQEKLRYAESQLTDYISSITEKNELIGKIREELDQQTAGSSDKVQFLNELMQFSLLTENDWIRFKQLFEKVHPYFFASLKEKFPELTPAETRLLALLKLNLSPREMSAILGISPDSITKLKYRLRKKLAVNEQENDLELLVRET